MEHQVFRTVRGARADLRSIDGINLSKLCFVAEERRRSVCASICSRTAQKLYVICGESMLASHVGVLTDLLNDGREPLRNTEAQVERSVGSKDLTQVRKWTIIDEVAIKVDRLRDGNY